MGDLRKRIKNSKSAIEKSSINNPNELYKKAYENKKEKRYKPSYKLILRYVCMLILIVITSISSIAIYKEVTFEKPKNPIGGTGNQMQEDTSEVVKNFANIEEMSYIINNSLVNDSSSAEGGIGGSIDGSMSVTPLPQYSASSKEIIGDVNLDRVYNTTNIRESNVDEEDIVKVNGDYIYYIPSRPTLSQIDINGNYEQVKLGENCIYVLKTSADGVEVIRKIKLEYEDKLITEDSDAKVYEIKESTPIGLYFTENYLIVRASTNIKSCIKMNSGENTYTNYRKYIELLIYDAKTYNLVKNISLPGNSIGTRLVGNELYVISSYNEYLSNGIYIPKYYLDGFSNVGQIIDIYYCPYFGTSISSYVNIYKISLNKDKIEVDDLYFVTSYISNIYVTDTSIYLIKKCEKEKEITKEKNSSKDLITYWPSTRIIEIDLEEFKFDGFLEVKGNIMNSYCIDEYNGYLRVVTNGRKLMANIIGGIYEYNYRSSYFTILTVFERNNKGMWEKISSSNVIKDSQTERMKSARFNKDTATIVTQEETDPLYVIDLSDPRNPKITTELKINGFGKYQQPYKENYVIDFGYETNANGRTIGYKITLFDISDKENVVQVGNPLVYSYDIYKNFKVLTDPKSLLLDLDNDIFGCPLLSIEGVYKINGRISTLYKSIYNIYKIDVNNKENPISVIKSVERIDGVINAVNVYDRMVFVGDKYYCLSFDEVHTYQLTSDGLVYLGNQMI